MARLKNMVDCGCNNLNTFSSCVSASVGKLFSRLPDKIKVWSAVKLKYFCSLEYVWQGQAGGKVKRWFLSCIISFQSFRPLLVYL